MDKQKDKKTKIIKEEDMIKSSDYEDSNDNKKLIIVALILALLIGGFAYIRSLETKKEDNGDKIEEPIKKPTEEKPAEEQPTTPSNNQTTTPSVTPVKEEIDIWADLKNLPSEVELGSEFNLPDATTYDNGNKITATRKIVFEYRNEIAEVEEFSTETLGEFTITYTFTFSDGRVEVKEVKIKIVDTKEPVINNIIDGQYFNIDVTPEIVEAGPYLMLLNGQEYNGETITEEGTYTLIVTEDTEEGKAIQVTFTIDKTTPRIFGPRDGEYYQDGDTVLIEDVNLDTIVVTLNGEEISFVKDETVLSEEGIYVITATDKACNKTIVTFTIDRTAPIINVEYSSDGTELVEKVTVTITSNEKLQELQGWTLSEDGLTLTREYTSNTYEELQVSDLAGNKSNVTIDLDYIGNKVTYNPSLTLENLVANKVKATITSLKQLTISEEGWTESLEDGIYKYEKVYDTAGEYNVNYTDSDNNTGVINIKINIELNSLFVEYSEDPTTQDVTAFVKTEEEVTNIPEGWQLDANKSGNGQYVYYKVYTDNVEYELVEFLTENKHYAATIIIDSIDRTAPNALVNVTYETDELGNKTKVEITVTADEEITDVSGWVLSSDKKSISKIIDVPTNAPTTDINEQVTITDLKGNNTVVNYSYNWN